MTKTRRTISSLLVATTVACGALVAVNDSPRSHSDATGDECVLVADGESGPVTLYHPDYNEDTGVVYCPTGESVGY